MMERHRWVGLLVTDMAEKETFRLFVQVVHNISKTTRRKKI